MTTNTFHTVIGTGPLGISTARDLVALGQPVRMVNRSGRAPEGVPAGVTTAAGDVSSLEGARAATAGSAVVYNCTNAPYDKWQTEMKPLFVNILEGAIATGAKLVLGDNLYAYGETNGAPMREDTPERPNSRKGALRSELGRIMLAAHRAGRTPVAIVRGSDYFGPRVRESQMGERVFPAALAGKAAMVTGKLDQPHSNTYIPDMGRAMALVGTRGSAFGQIWHAPNSPAQTARQMLERIYAEVGKPMKVQVAGRAMLSVLGLFNPVIREVVEMQYQFERPFVVDSGKFEREFGVRATAMQEAIEATMAWYRAH
jgi:nucleoside-diphosphate-sugar epimerase